MTNYGFIAPTKFCSCLFADCRIIRIEFGVDCRLEHIYFSGIKQLIAKLPAATINSTGHIVIGKPL